MSVESVLRSRDILAGAGLKAWLRLLLDEEEKMLNAILFLLKLLKGKLKNNYRYGTEE